MGLGMIDLVTKENAGALFYDELAKQIFGVFDPILRRKGGAMPLVEVFAYYNRQRATDLVSPGDVLSACKKIPSLGFPMRLKTFQSGVIILEHSKLM